MIGPLLVVAVAFFVIGARAVHAQSGLRSDVEHEIATIFDLLRSRSDEAALARAIALRDATRVNPGPKTSEYLWSLKVLAEAQKNKGSLLDSATTRHEALDLVIELRSIEDVEIYKERREVMQAYAAAGAYRSAADVFDEAVALLEKNSGGANSTLAMDLHTLATLRQNDGDLVRAEDLMRRSLQIFRSLPDTDQLTLAKVSTDLARILVATRSFGAAEPLLDEALKTLDDPDTEVVPQTAKTLQLLAEVYRSTGRPELASRTDARAQVQAPQQLESSAALLETLRKQVRAYSQASSDAVPIARQLALLTEQLFGSRRLVTGIAINDLGQILSENAKFGEAEILLKRAISIVEPLAEKDDLSRRNLASSLNNLGLLYIYTARNDDAIPILLRVIGMDQKFEEALPADLAVSYNNLGLAYQRTSRLDKAEAAYRKALAIDESASGPNSSLLGIRLNNLASVLQLIGKSGEGELLLRRSRQIAVADQGADGLGPAAIDGMIAGSLAAQGQTENAIKLNKHAIHAAEVYLAKDQGHLWSRVRSDEVLMNLKAGLGDVHILRSEWRDAVAVLGDAVKFAVQQVISRSSTLQQVNAGVTVQPSLPFQRIFENYLIAEDNLESQESPPSAELARSSFESAQWLKASSTAAAISEMATRGAKSDANIEKLVRMQQDLMHEKFAIDANMNASFAAPATERVPKVDHARRSRLAEIDSEVATIADRLAHDYPDYAAFANPRPSTITEVQGALKEDEALILFLDTLGWPSANKTFIWAVTKTNFRWVSSELPASSLEREVAALRCGLDQASWYGDGAKACADLLSMSLEKASKDGHPLPFDHAGAYKLYKALFGEIEDLINGKHLLVIPSGALTRLPMQVLITKPPHDVALSSSDAWLVRDHAITVLPAVSSLKALRAHASRSKGERPMIAFANPLLEGVGSRPSNAVRKAAAKYREDCKLPDSRDETMLDFAAGLGVKSERVINVGALEPVPRTAKLVCEIAADPAFAGSEVHLGRNATEANLRELNKSGQLANFRIVQFATHGVTAGQVVGKLEPGLILTPSNTVENESNDGYLSASEITELKLDADWVILSACNTAAGNGGQGESDATTTGEALSGLARAFIYAQTRALLVSHWSVNEEAAVKLVTSAMRHLGKKGVGRSEGLRRAMLELADSPDPRQSHPSYWAPFVVVGEGAAEP